MSPQKSKYRDEDLFKDSTMTFGEHLDELRKCLVKAVYGLVIAFIVVLAFGWADGVVRYIQKPLKEALERFYLMQAHERAQERLAEFAAAGIPVSSYYGVYDAIQYGRMTPTFYRMDVRTVLQEVVQKFDPSMPLPDIARFRAVDFLDAAKFCQDVYTSREQDASVAKWIWSKMPETTQQIIKACTDGKGDLKKQKPQLADAIEKGIILQEKFYDENRAFFDEARKVPYVALEETKERARRLGNVIDSRGELEPRDFNRLLLSMALPGTIAAGPREDNMVALTLWRPVSEDPRVTPGSWNAHEMFFVLIKAALVLSLVVASPWVFYHLWSFVGAGLYPHEKRYIHVFLPFSLALFLAGVALCFFLVFRFVLDFLFWFNNLMEVDANMRITEWFGFALFLPLGFGLAFQLPLVMLFLERIGVMTAQAYLSKLRMAILVIFVISMMLTPADPYSMVLMAIPLVVLYFLGIGLCRFMPRGRNPFAGVDEPS